MDMKKLLGLALLLVLTITLAACGGTKFDGTYGSQSKVIVVDKDRYTLYDKGEPDDPITTQYFTIVKEDKASSKMVVDISDKEGGKPFTRETWYKFDDEVEMILEDGSVFEAYEEDGLKDYKIAE